MSLLPLFLVELVESVIWPLCLKAFGLLCILLLSSYLFSNLAWTCWSSEQHVLCIDLNASSSSTNLSPECILRHQSWVKPLSSLFKDPETHFKCIFWGLVPPPPQQTPSTGATIKSPKALMWICEAPYSDLKSIPDLADLRRKPIAVKEMEKNINWMEKHGSRSIFFRA